MLEQDLKAGCWSRILERVLKQDDRVRYQSEISEQDLEVESWNRILKQDFGAGCRSRISKRDVGPGSWNRISEQDVRVGSRSRISKQDVGAAASKLMDKVVEHSRI